MTGTNPSQQASILNPARAIRRHLVAALAFVGLLAGTAVAWSVYVPLDGAIVAAGTVMVESNVKKVQHATGGIVGALNVKEGSVVKAGEVLLRLDDTNTRAKLAIIENELMSSRARLARLEAERDGLPAPAFPDDLFKLQATSAAARQVLDGEKRVFDARQRTTNGQKAQLSERIKQLREEITGLEQQKSALAEQLKIAGEEIADLSGLKEQGLVQRPRLSALQREHLRTEGSVGDLKAKIAQAQGRISEIELQMLQVDRDMATEAAKELRDIETKITEYRARETAAKEELQRIDVRAPISGQVHQLSVHTVGGVISPTEPIMLIVPAADKLIVEVRIAPNDIDQLQLGQETRIRFSAFNHQTTPELKGSIFRIAGDLTREQQTGLAYYTAAIRVSDEELEKLRDMKLVPGMPAEAYIKTGARTLASFLLKPMTDQMEKALRE